MNIERKFKMFSTKEWIQYLQYKLSPEREKELEVQSAKDEFLKEAIDTIGDKENRAISYQSVSFLINEVEHYTGVSESKISRVKERADYDTSAPVDWKMIGLVGAGVLLICLVIYGVFSLATNLSNSPEQEQTMIEAESVSSIQSYADSSSLPMETIPNASSGSKIDTASTRPAVKVNPSSAASKPTVSNSLQSNNNTPARVVNASPSNSSVAGQKERELFNQAQEIYKQGNREGARRILRELKSYDNPMKSQAETILKNMGN
jgi:hypothetical protein